MKSIHISRRGSISMEFDDPTSVDRQSPVAPSAAATYTLLSSSRASGSTPGAVGVGGSSAPSGGGTMSMGHLEASTAPKLA